MKEIKCRVIHENKLKRLKINKLDNHPLFNYKANASEETIKSDDEKFINRIAQCPQATRIWKKLIYKTKTFNHYPKEIRTYLYLNDPEIIKIETELMESLKNCKGDSK